MNLANEWNRNECVRSIQMSSVGAENECVGCCFRFEGVKRLPFEEDARAIFVHPFTNVEAIGTSKGNGMVGNGNDRNTRMKYVAHNLRLYS